MWRSWRWDNVIAKAAGLERKAVISDSFTNLLEIIFRLSNFEVFSLQIKGFRMKNFSPILINSLPRQFNSALRQSLRASFPSCRWCEDYCVMINVYRFNMAETWWIIYDNRAHIILNGSPIKIVQPPLTPNEGTFSVTDTVQVYCAKLQRIFHSSRPANMFQRTVIQNELLAVWRVSQTEHLVYDGY